MYGTELILDLHDCDPKQFTRGRLTIFFAELCDLIDMKAEDLHFWDDQDVRSRSVRPTRKRRARRRCNSSSRAR